MTAHVSAHISNDALIPLANHLWQSTLFVVPVWTLTLLLRKNAAAVRHRLWLAASVKFLVPFSLLINLGAHIRWQSVHSAAPRPLAITTVIGQPFPPPTVYFDDASRPMESPSSRLPEALGALWICGFAACLGWWSVRWNSLRRKVKNSMPLHLDLPVRAVLSSERIEPGVFGVFRPVLLLPEGITERLSPDQMTAMLAHEMCHVRRRDNIASALHMFVEAVFWFHPLVWWIERRLVEEQERACDEEVLRRGGDSHIYAESILRICEFCLASPLLCVSGITGSGLRKRMGEIMRNRMISPLSLARRAGLAVAALLALTSPVIVGIALRAQSARTFEVASVKARGNDGGRAFPACQGGMLQVDPGRLIASDTTLFAMITWAYGIRYSCFIVSDKGLLSGGPSWILTDRFDVEATIPPDIPKYTAAQLQNGAAPELQAMLRALLEERFKLALHRGMKEVPVYDLTLAAGGAKLAPPNEADPKSAGIGLVPDENNEILVHLGGNKASIDDLAHVIEPVTHTPVLDHTGLKGEYRFDVKFAVIEPFTGELRNLVGATSPTIYSVLEKQLGLKIAPGKGTVETWVIDRAEKPAEN